MKDVLISVIMAAHNAREYIAPVIEALSTQLSANYKDYEIVIVDDGSRDRTAEAVEELQKKISNIQLYVLSRHYGEAIAAVVGLDHAIGDHVAIMDPETDTPETIPQMVELARSGVDVVYGVDTKRDALYNKLAKSFYGIFQRLTGGEIPQEASKFRLFSRTVVNYITAVSDRHQLLKVLPAISGFSHATVNYTAKPSARTRNVFVQIGEGIAVLFHTSVKPLRFATYTALTAGFLNLLYAVYVVIIALTKRFVAEGWVSLSLQNSGMFFLICVVLTIISEYLYGIMERTQNRPLYHIAKESSSMVFKRKAELNVVEKG